jgi:hypothetical protein
MNDDDVAFGFRGAEPATLFLFGHVHGQFVCRHREVGINHLNISNKHASSRCPVKVKCVSRCDFRWPLVLGPSLEEVVRFSRLVWFGGGRPTALGCRRRYRSSSRAFGLLWFTGGWLLSPRDATDGNQSGYRQNATVFHCLTADLRLISCLSAVRDCK